MVIPYASVLQIKITNPKLDWRTQIAPKIKASFTLLAYCVLTNFDFIVEIAIDHMSTLADVIIDQIRGIAFYMLILS